MSEDRFLYVQLFEDIFNKGISLSDAKETVSDKVKPFFNMLFMTSLRQLNFIKVEVLPQFIKKKIPQKQKILETILFLGITELLFLDTAPYAVVNSYTDIAKKKTNQFGGNFVNAVLRNVLRNKESILQNRKSGYFCADFLKVLKQDYTSDVIKEMEDFVSLEPALDLTLKRDCSISIEGGIVLPTGSLRLSSNTKVTSIPYYDDGLWWVQDAASALPVKCLGQIKGKKVLDLCAAPGGKTAQLLDAKAYVTAVDVSQKRLDKLEENLGRLNLKDNLKVVCADATNFEIDDVFDIILIDAPCSATGTFRRHPEIIHTKTIKDVQKQANLQKDILDHAIKFLNPHGVLVYSTCSLSKQEGERQIQNFLKSHKEFDIVPIDLAGTEKMRTEEGFLRILPQHFREFSGIDGFFIAVLKRKI